VTRRDGPTAELKVERSRVSEVLAALLDGHTLVDVSVQDPPLDQVIARVFESSKPPELVNKTGDGELAGRR
jgi:ABC-2 type transport system ATP-binding protein